ncbi:MAG: hypothetical protein AB7E13_03995 [Arcobacteraceae bacterium]
MKYTNIVCLDDLIRQEYSKAKEFFYNILREPIKQATDIDIKSSPRFDNYQNNMKDTFSIDKFLAFFDKKWNYYYHQIPTEAEEYLADNIPSNTLIISYEIPIWLEKFCEKNKIDFIDIRISPIKFARDLYICIKTNNKKLTHRFLKYKVLNEEIKLEASLLKAFGRYKSQTPIASNSIIFVGQTADDASLVNEQGDFITVDDLNIDEIFRDKNVYYVGHPYAKEHSKLEFKNLKKYCNKIEILDDTNIYNLMSSHSELEFISISSGVIQEAPYFDKQCQFLHKPICPIDDNNGYIQIHFKNIIEPIFWHKILKPKKDKPKLKRLPDLQPNMLRTLHNAWWGYARFVSDFKYIDKEAFWLSGGNKLQNEINALQEALKRIDTVCPK